MKDILYLLLVYLSSLATCFGQVSVGIELSPGLSTSIDDRIQINSNRTNVLSNYSIETTSIKPKGLFSYRGGMSAQYKNKKARYSSGILVSKIGYSSPFSYYPSTALEQNMVSRYYLISFPIGFEYALLEKNVTFNVGLRLMNSFPVKSSILVYDHLKIIYKEDRNMNFRYLFAPEVNLGIEKSFGRINIGFNYYLTVFVSRALDSEKLISSGISLVTSLRLKK